MTVTKPERKERDYTLDRHDFFNGKLGYHIQVNDEEEDFDVSCGLRIYTQDEWTAEQEGLVIEILDDALSRISKVV